MGGAALWRSIGCSLGTGGFSEPGFRISKPVPWPRITWEARFSKDVRVGGGSFSSAAPSDAGMMGLEGAESYADWLSLCCPTLCVLSLLLDLKLSGSASCDVLLQNSAKGVTSGMLDLRTAGGKASSLGVENGLVGEPSPDVVEIVLVCTEK